MVVTLAKGKSFVPFSLDAINFLLADVHVTVRQISSTRRFGGADRLRHWDAGDRRSDDGIDAV